MKPLVLNATDKSIEAVMSGAAATTNPDFTAHYGDATSSAFTEGANDGTLNGTTPVVLVAAPAASTRRVVNQIIISNVDTAAVTITITYESGANSRRLWYGTLQENEMLTLEGSFDENGALKTAIATIPAHGHTSSSNGGQLDASAVFSTGTVPHEHGGLEADVSAYSGLVKITGGATSAVTAPTGAIVGTTDTQDLSNKTFIDGVVIDGSADEIQLRVKGHSTQTSSLLVLENDAGDDQVTISNTGAVVINEQGNDADFRVEGDTDANLLFVDASADSVGVGTNAPGAKLDVRGSVIINEAGADADVRIEGDTDVNLFFTDASTDRVGIGTNTPGAKLDVRGSAIFNEAGDDVDFRVESDGDANAFFVDGGNNNVGIGTGTPNAFALLELASTTKALLIPRMTTTQRDALTPVNGMEIYNSTLAAMQDYVDGAWVSRLRAGYTTTYVSTADLTFASTTSETSLWSGTGVGTLTIPANTLAVGTVLRCKILGTISRASGTFTFRARLGGTEIGASGAVYGAGTQVAMRFVLDYELTVRAIGASGSVIGAGSTFNYFVFPTATDREQSISANATTIDTTGNLAFDITAQPSASAAGNGMTITHAVFEVIAPS